MSTSREADQRVAIVSTARRAGTCASQRLKFEKRFQAVIPRDGKLVSIRCMFVGSSRISLLAAWVVHRKLPYPRARQCSSFLNCNRKSFVIPMEDVEASIEFFSSESRSSRDCTKYFRDASASSVSGHTHESFDSTIAVA